jgi:WD40-like Beta Propeller Repeat
VRRHAKASTAGSTQRQANRLGRFMPAAILTALGVAMLLALSAAPSLAAECPNEIRRQEQGVSALALPDCRAYENASPGSQPHTSGGERSEAAQASISGDQIFYNSKYPAGDAEHSGQWYVSARGATGWSPETIVPQQTPDTAGSFGCDPSAIFSPDFSQNIFEQDLRVYPGESGGGNGNGFCTRSEELLDPREEVGYRNVLLHDNATGSYELVSLNEEAGTPGNSRVVGMSDDFSRIFFRSEAQLTPEAPGVTPDVVGGFNLFVWSQGTVRLVTFLPDGTPVSGGLPGHFPGEPDSQFNSVAADGNSVAFEHEGDLYVRLNPTEPPSAIAGEECTEPAKACTVQIDESQGPGASGGGDFEVASDDGSRVFFLSDHKLTADSTAVAGEADLYEYDVDTGALTDLTVNASEPAGVWSVEGWADDTSELYFVAEAALAPGALAGGCAHYDEGATCNLYRLHEGAIEFVASISVNDRQLLKTGGDFSPSFNYNGSALAKHGRDEAAAQASPDGRYFAFLSYQSITGYESTNPETGHPVKQIYLYDSVGETVECVSCPYAGAPVIGPSEFFLSSYPGRIVRLRLNHVTDSGQVFFATEGALVPADVNETSDVYEWSEGEAHLISTGRDPDYTDLAAVSPDGSDVFFTTAEGILDSDTDGKTTMYDARVGGGFPEPPPLPGCESEACRGAGTSAPGAAATGTAAFQGAGNLKQRHKRDCGITAKRAQKVSRAAKRLRRKAKRAHDPKVSKRLRRRSAKLAKQSRRLSKGAKRCRRANRRAGK